MQRIRSTWASGVKGKLAVGCSALLLTTCLCLSASVWYSQTPSALQASATTNARLTATNAAKIAATPVLAQAQPTTAPVAAKPTEVPRPTDPPTPVPPSATPQPPPTTPAPSNTPVPPTEAPPTNPPPRTNPPPPTATPAPVRAVLNGQRIESVFREQGFVFENSTPVDNQPRRMANASSRLTLIELIGNPTNLTKATIAVGLPNNNRAAAERSGVYMALFLNTALPGWDNGINWVTASLKAFSEGQEETTNSYQGRNLKMTNHTKTLGLIFLTIE